MYTTPRRRWTNRRMRLVVLVLAALLWGLVSFVRWLASGSDSAATEAKPPATKKVGWQLIREEMVSWPAQRVDDLVGYHLDQGATLAATRACNEDDHSDLSALHVGSVVKICRPLYKASTANASP